MTIPGSPKKTTQINTRNTTAAMNPMLASRTMTNKSTAFRKLPESIRL